MVLMCLSLSLFPQPKEQSRAAQRSLHSSCDLLRQNFFFVRVSGERLAHAAKTLSAAIPCCDRSNDRASQERGVISEVSQTSLCLLPSTPVTPPPPLSLCLFPYLSVSQSLFLTVYQSFILSLRLPSRLSLCLLTDLSISLLDRVCLPAFISPSASVQPDLTVVSGLFQSITGWLTDLWAD